MGEANNGRLNVARLANIPKSVIDVAGIKSRALEESIKERKLAHLYVIMCACAYDPSLTRLDHKLQFESWVMETTRSYNGL